MLKLIYQYWGKTKKDPERGGVLYHLLVYHCLDVAAVGWVFLEKETQLRKKFSQALNLSEENFQKLFCFFLCLHDLGKFSAAFQNLNQEVFIRLAPYSFRREYTKRHDSLGYWVLFEFLSKKHPAFQVFSQAPSKQRLFKKYLDLWFQLVTGHHGKPPLRSESETKLELYFVEKDYQAIMTFVDELVTCFDIDFDKILTSVLTRENLNCLKKYSWTLAGLTTFCDWIGSNTDYFKYLCEPDYPLGHYFRERAQEGARKALADFGVLSKPISSYQGPQSLFSYLQNLTPLQEFCHKVSLNQGAQLWIMEDITGSGKTEAAMLLTHRLMDSGMAQGCFIGLPTMATADGMYERMESAYRYLYQGSAEPSLVLAHGARHLSKRFRKSVMAGIEKAAADQNYQSQEATASAQCATWLADSTKKSLLADIGVGTLDQLLLAILPARYQSLRFFGLNSKVLVVDEVHAYDPYMTHLLNYLLEGHAQAGGSAILLSATLPKKLREGFVAAWKKGLSVEAQNDSFDLNEDAYPLVTSVSSQGVEEFSVEAWESVKRQVGCALIHQEDEIFSLIKKTVERGQCFCWIRNTIKDANEAYEKLKKADWIKPERLTLFHARFALKDRLAKQDRVLNTFGKKSGGDVRFGQVLIATQIVEQSLDLDFDVMLSDLAPIDLLIQRMGRLQRHPRDATGFLSDREEVRKKPVFYVYGPQFTQEPKVSWYKEVFKGASYVYPDVGRLWLTQGLLKNHPEIKIPEDCRALIEGVYGDEAVEIPASLIDPSDKAWSQRSTERELARLSKLRLEEGYSFASQRAWEEEAKVATRLAEDQRRCYLVLEEEGSLKPLYKEKFAWDLSSVKVPRYLLEEVILTEDQEQQVKIIRENFRNIFEGDLILPVSLVSQGKYVAKGYNETGEPVEVNYDAENYGLYIVKI